MHIIIMESDAPNVTLAMGRSLNAEGIKSGDDVYFDCHVDARPSASRIEWARNVSSPIYRLDMTIK